ncbi:MAG: SH3 domain-containing protein [Micropruina sp.]|uniref:SH3 domain-containing protein n=1 Tax=Micropruina sp. TaxID=2737536 RepID=UPI0039E5AECD
MARRGATVALALTALLAGCTAAPAGPQDPTPSTNAGTATPLGPPVKGSVRTNKKTQLSLRAAPTTQSKRLARIPNKTTITLLCKTVGSTVSNGSHASNVWNQITWKKKTGYVASVYVDGGDSAALSLCQMAAPTPSATPTRPADVEQLIVKAARAQRGVTERKTDCTPYGGCMPWDSLYVTWVWNKAGDAVPRFSFSGDLYSWGKKHDRAHDGVDGVGPGDLVLYGTGPENTKTSTHVDIVTEVLPDGKLRVIGGNVKNKVTERVVPTKGIYGWVDA